MLHPHLHPLSDPESVHFVLAPTKPFTAALLGTRVREAESRNYEIRLEPVPGHHAAKALASINTFALPTRYAGKVEEIFRLRRQLITLNPRRTMLAELLPDLRMQTSDTLGFDVNDNSYKHVSLGKLKRDIYMTLQIDLTP